ncbi:MAG: hypothetical protein HKN16_07670, partial [Saprospiraceae bacterium]|nr:hypothetical protein [Saprospiraceae bacterium]
MKLFIDILDSVKKTELNMNSKFWLIIAFGLTLNNACNNPQSSNPSDEDIWRLGWRLIESSMDENFETAEIQFDSLLNITDAIDYKFLVTGLEVKAELNKENEIG